MSVLKPLDYQTNECKNPVCMHERTRNLLLMKQIEFDNSREQVELKYREDRKAEYIIYLNKLKAESVIHNLKNVDMLELRRCKKALVAKDKYIDELKKEIEELRKNKINSSDYIANFTLTGCKRFMSDDNYFYYSNDRFFFEVEFNEKYKFIGGKEKEKLIVDYIKTNTIKYEKKTNDFDDEHMPELLEEFHEGKYEKLEYMFTHNNNECYVMYIVKQKGCLISDFEILYTKKL